MTGLQKLLAAAIAVGVLAHFVDPRDATRRNFEFMPEMVESPSYRPQDKNENFPNGMTAQVPPVGSVARGFLPLHVNSALLDTRTEWKQLNPKQQDAWNAYKAPAVPEAGAEAQAERGRVVFQIICRTCHGAGGTGDGAVTKRGVPPPPSLLADGAKAMSDGRMFRIITAGQGNMAAHAGQVTRADRWKVVAHIRRLQK